MKINQYKPGVGAGVGTGVGFGVGLEWVSVLAQASVLHMNIKIY